MIRYLWDASAEQYERLAGTFRRYAITSGAVVRLADPPAGAFVVDLGSGTGITARILLDRLGPPESGARLLACDFAASMVEATRRAIGGDPRVRVALADGTDGDALAAAVRAAADGAAPCVITANALFPEVFDAEALFSAVSGVLAPGGRLVFSIPARSCAGAPPRRPAPGDFLVERLEARLRAALGVPADVKLAPETYRPLSITALWLAAKRSGLALDVPETVEVEESFAEHLAWARLPVFRAAVALPSGADGVFEMFERELAPEKKEALCRELWLVLVARKPAAPP